uniref:Uncharacterized protein n=1 Tax=Rousettus aegyptiacus TaxID=9407 RepID=A0A7J8G9V7_ROUAE|nr:hypothetical protein HJG63_011537 [Rousettus aegyptiacus]
MILKLHFPEEGRGDLPIFPNKDLNLGLFLHYQQKHKLSPPQPQIMQSSFPHLGKPEGLMGDLALEKATFIITVSPLPGRREEGHVKMEAEVGVRQPQTKERQEPPEAGGSKDSPLEAWQEPGSAETLISDLWFPEL